MMIFLKSNRFTKEAVEGIEALLFGDLAPNEAAKLDGVYSQVSDKDKIKIIIEHIISSTNSPIKQHFYETYKCEN
jgi:hypothetical protein